MVQSNISLEQFDEEEDAHSHEGCGSCGTGQALAGMVKCGNGLEKIYPTTAVRYGYMRYIGEFSHPTDMKFTCGAKVVIQTRRGIEMGDQVSLTCHGCEKSVTREKMREWVDTCGEDAYLFDAGRILREATAADLAENARIQNGCREKRDFCQRLARQLNLPMKIVDCEAPFGGERILFYFTANDRVDFRVLVKELADEYRTRIEMRQVGARDEARLLADFETCGREVCCKVFLKTLRPISMRMAKLQKATLDPTQVSGRCGRLKCCLRYEHMGYEELDKTLPRQGLRVRTNHGDGVIINRQILTQLVQIKTDAGDVITVVAEDILEVGAKVPPRSAPGEISPPPGRSARPPKPPRGPQRPLRDLANDPPIGQSPPAENTTPGLVPPVLDDDRKESAGKADQHNLAGEAERDQRRGRRRRGRRRGGPSEGPRPGPSEGGASPGV